MIDWEPKVGDICWFITRYHDELKNRYPVIIIKIRESTRNEKPWGPFHYEVHLLNPTKRSIYARQSDLMKMPEGYRAILALSS